MNYFVTYFGTDVMTYCFNNFCCILEACFQDGWKYGTQAQSGNLMTRKVENANDCQTDCQNTINCVAWTYKPDQSECNKKLEGSINSLQPKNNRISGPKYCGGEN